MPDQRPRTRFIFITGGVVSSLGKGIAAASIGRLLVSRGLKVAIQKFDPYINVDPGTMSPFQHGEVFVTEDGAETDLDLGHYERSSVTNTSPCWNGDIVPGSMLMYGSNFCRATLRPRETSRRPIEAAAMPLPSEETTPPVTKMKRVRGRDSGIRNPPARPV